MATLFTVEGEEKTVEPKGDTFSLEELQKYVEGYVEIVTLKDNKLLAVNEEGRLKNLPVNIPASRTAKMLIVGPALLLESEQIE